jgi:hypothetical protein
LDPAAGLGPFRLDEAFLPVGVGLAGREAGELAAQLELCELWPFSSGTSSPLIGVPLGRHEETPSHGLL